MAMRSSPSSHRYCGDPLFLSIAPKRSILSLRCLTIRSNSIDKKGTRTFVMEKNFARSIIDAISDDGKEIVVEFALEKVWSPMFWLATSNRDNGRLSADKWAARHGTAIHARDIWSSIKKKKRQRYKRWPAVTASSRSDINGDQTPHILCSLCPRCVYILVRHYVPVIMCTHTPPFDTMEWSMIVPNMDRQVNFSTFCSVSLFPFFSFSFLRSILRFYLDFGIEFRKSIEILFLNPGEQN